MKDPNHDPQPGAQSPDDKVGDGATDPLVNEMRALTAALKETRESFNAAAGDGNGFSWAKVATIIAVISGVGWVIHTEIKPLTETHNWLETAILSVAETPPDDEPRFANFLRGILAARSEDDRAVFFASGTAPGSDEPNNAALGDRLKLAHGWPVEMILPDEQKLIVTRYTVTDFPADQVSFPKDGFVRCANYKLDTYDHPTWACTCERPDGVLEVFLVSNHAASWDRRPDVSKREDAGR